MNESCEFCKFLFVPDEDARRLKIGYCRRYPPQVYGYVYTSSDGDITTGDTNDHPKTNFDDWCGEFRRKEP